MRWRRRGRSVKRNRCRNSWKRRKKNMWRKGWRRRSVVEDDVVWMAG